MTVVREGEPDSWFDFAGHRFPGRREGARAGILRAVLVAAAFLAAGVWGAATVLAQQSEPQGVDFSAVAGQQVTTTVATFEGAGIAERYSAVIAWGDGTPDSEGTVSQMTPCSNPDASCFEVAGTHTYATPGIYTVTIAIDGAPEGARRATATATVTVPPGPPPPPPAPGPAPPGLPTGASAGILGPARVLLTEPVRFVAQVAPAALRYEWDLDGDGSYERDIGTSAAVDPVFPHGGGFRVGLRATLPGGAVLTSAREVQVSRPPVIGLDVVGPRPDPGQRVRLRLGIAKERATRFEAFAWRIGGVRPRRRALVLPGARGGPDQVVRLKGAQPTRKPTLVTSFPKKGTFPVVVEALDTDGHSTTLHASVTVGGGFPSRPLGGAPIDCDKAGVPGGFCPQVFVLSEPATKVKTAFAFTAPSAKACIPKNATLEEAKKLGKLQDALDLPYPAPGQFGAGPLGAAGASGGRRVRAALEVQEDCLEAEPEALRWTFGDGGTLEAPPGGSVPKIVSHVYGAEGTYTATVLARVPYFVQSAKPLTKLKASDFWELRYKLATKSIQVEVEDAHCGVLKLNGISLSSVPGTAGKFDIPDIAADGCFLPDESLGGGKTLYKTFTGYDLDLNTVAVRSGSPSAGDPDDVEIVDVSAAQIRSMPGELLEGRFSGGSGGASGSWQIFDGRPVIEVPKPKPDAELGGPVAPLQPGFATGPSLTGLSVQAVHVFLSPDRGALARLFLRTPKPLQGSAPVVLGGGPKVLASSEHPEEQPDLTMDLSGLDLGLFEIQDFKLGHRPSGGWFGGGSLRVPALDFSFLAPYRPPPKSDPTSAECKDVDGPSGISLDPDGNFKFGGFTAKVAVPIPPVMKLECIAVAGQSEPFVMVGKVSGKVPPPGPFTVDGCFLMGILQQGQTAAGCGGSATAQGNLTWFRAAGGVRVYFLKLAGGHLDVRKDADLFQATAKGTVDHSVGIDLGPVEGSLGVKGSVSGAVVFQPSFGFHLIGNVGLCVENPGPDLGCVDIAKAGVSSKGFGACSWLASFVYNWDGGPDAWLGNCNLESEIGVTSAFVQPTLLGGPLVRGSPSARPVRLPAGLSQVGFRVRGDGAPLVSVSGPGGRRIVDDGSAVQRTRGHDVIHGTGETLVVVRRPQAGLWRVATLPGSAAITRVGVSMPLPEPDITARLRGRGRTRLLAYRAKLARTDRLTFVEEGRTLTRQLGRARSRGIGRIRFHSGNGSPGRRRIYAVVERRGVVYRRIRLASYRAPRPMRPSRPRGLRLRVVKARGRVAWRRDLVARWRRSRGAEHYEIVARISDGRALQLRTRRPALRLPTVERSLGVRLTIVAVGADGHASTAARGRLRAQRPIRIIARL